MASPFFSVIGNHHKIDGGEIHRLCVAFYTAVCTFDIKFHIFISAPNSPPGLFANLISIDFLSAFSDPSSNSISYSLIPVRCPSLPMIRYHSSLWGTRTWSMN